MQKFYVALLAFIATLFSVSINAQIVISQVYGGGGNSGATYKNDFIELFNPTNLPVNLAGWSVQYASATGSSWAVTNLTNFTLQPGQYYLIQQAAGTGGTVVLPTPDATGTLAMSATAGKVALVNTTTALTGTCPTVGVIDLVGFGTANCFEGSGTTPALSNTTAALRLNNGCTDTDNNNLDFTTGAPSPRNSSSSIQSCTALSFSVSVSAGNSASEPLTNGSFIITLSHPAPAGGVTISYTFSGTATFGTDYANLGNGTITITEGSETGIIHLNVIDDAIYEGTEIITITLQTASNGFNISTTTASIDLMDNELPPATSAKIVINEVYGGGGNAGSVYRNDFIELYNPNNFDVVLTGWSIQYASATGSSWQKTDLAGTIPANGFYLIQQAVGAGGTTNLPAPDATGGIAMAAGVGKVALVNNTIGLTGTCPSGAHIIDLVGFGSTANCFEGSGPTPAPSNTNSVQRTPVGRDTDNNSLDFTALLPNPSNSSMGSDVTAPVIISLVPADNATSTATSFTASITFNEPIQKGTSGTITVRKLSDNQIVLSILISSSLVFVSGNTVTFDVHSLAFNTAYYIEITNGGILDNSKNDFAGINGNTTWNFTTSATPPAGSLNITYTFNNCTSALPDGFTQYSISGDQKWTCTSFGRNNTNGINMNGFANGTNRLNEDWLISPAFDLTGTIYPLLSFWSRTEFNGAPLQLKISTNYSGTGDPSHATWTDLNGKFPALASNVWTLSENINLSAFKQTSVYIAFVYHSSEEEGARWTIDDFTIINSSTPPPPSLTVNTTDIQFNFVAAGSSADKTFTFIGNDLTSGVTLTSNGSFQISKDGTTFTSSVSYTLEEANDQNNTVYVRFIPTQNNRNFEGSIIVSTGSLSNIIQVKGTSIDPATTLEVVNWNIEWFGSPQFGPLNDERQEENVRNILLNTGADIYGLTEVVSEERLARVVSQMPGYAYVISDFGSHTNTTRNPESALAEAQKLAFVYKTSVITNLGTRALLSQGINSPEDITHPYYNYWSSGRFPFMMDAEVTLNCVTTRVKFILVHAKANTSPTTESYNRRKSGADVLYDSLQILFPEEKILIMGDFNDDFDQSITAGFTTTSWNKFINDEINFYSPTLSLSLSGKKSTVSYNDVIDHVIVSNELAYYYMPSSATILTDVSGYVTNYASTTSDHYPVFTRYRFEAPAPVITSCTQEKIVCESENGIYQIPAFFASSTCNGTISYSYTISGATNRTGTGNDASGAFALGTSIITWIAEDTNGEIASCETSVFVNANPVVTLSDVYALPAGVLPNTVYTGYVPASSVLLQPVVSEGSTPYQYMWSTGSISTSIQVSPTTTSTYTLEVTDTYGCKGAASKTISVIDVRGGKKLNKVNICHKVGQSKLLTVDASAVPAHLSHGDMLGACSSEDWITSSKINSAEIEEQKFSIIAMPNPSSTYFNLRIQSGNSEERIFLRITDMLGRTIEQFQNVPSTHVIRIGDNYKNGVYLVEVIQGSSKKHLKIVKNQ